eukprot:3834675-Rhodomonas_salina.2
MKHHVLRRLGQWEAGEGGDKADGDVIASACGDVLAVAWRLQHARWGACGPGKEGELALGLCCEMACAVLEH